MESVLLPYGMVLAGLLILSAFRSPVVLDRQREGDIEVHRDNATKLSQENLQLRSEIKQATAPKLTPFERAHMNLARDKLAELANAEIETLRFLLFHGGAEDRVVRDKGDAYFKGVVKLQKAGLVNDKKRNGERYWLINPDFTSALKRVLFEQAV